MNSTNSNVSKWPVSSRIFHWISAVLLLVTWIMILLYDNLDNNLYIGLHKAFGISLLCWMIARVLNRVFIKAPPPVPMPKWQLLASKLSHFGLYALLIAMPIAGLLMSVYGGRPVDFLACFKSLYLSHQIEGWHAFIMTCILILFGRPLLPLHLFISVLLYIISLSKKTI